MRRPHSSVEFDTFESSIIDKQAEGDVWPLTTHIPFEKEEAFREFTIIVDETTGKTNTMGILEQITEIRAQEAEESKSRQFIKNLLKKGGFSIQEISDLVGASIDFVIEVKKEK